MRPKNRADITPTEKAKIAFSATYEVIKGNYKELETMAFALDKKMQASDDQRTKVLYAQSLAYFYGTVRKTDKCYDYFLKVIEYAAGNPYYNHDVAEACIYLGGLHEKADSGVYYLHKGLDILGNNSTDSLLLLNAYNSYRLIYGKLELKEEAITYSNKCLNFIPAAKKWGYEYTATLIGKADLYSELYSQTKKKEYIDSSRKIVSQIMEMKKADAAKWYGTCYYILGRLQFWEGNYKEAMLLFDSCQLPQYVKHNYHSALLYKGICLVKMGKAEGVKILDSLKIDDDNYTRLKLLNQALYEYYRATGNWKTALGYHERYMENTDSLAVITQQGKVFEAQQKYSVAQKEADIAVLENKNLQEKNAKRGWAIASLVGFIVLITLLLLLYVYNKRQLAKRASERQLLENKLQAMEKDMLLQQTKQQAETENILVAQRKSISRDMHDEVSSSVATLPFLIKEQRLNTENKEAQAILTILEDEATQVYRQVRDFMLRLQTSNKQLTYNVADFLENLSITFGPGSSLLVNTAYDKENVEKYFTDRHHTETYLFIKEGVTNAMKHADASKIQIQVYLKEGNFHVSIADNGKGAEQTGKGIGMASMGERMKALGGKARFWTDAGMHVLGSFPAVAN